MEQRPATPGGIRRGGVLILLIGLILIFGAVALFLFINSGYEENQTLRVGTEIVQLRNCELVGVAAWGRYAPGKTNFFCQKDQLVVAYEMSGKIVANYEIPAGYDVVDVSDVGDYGNSQRTFYCRERTTGDVRVCLVE